MALRAPKENPCLRVGVATWPPFVYQKDGQWVGIMMDIMQILGSKLNFCYETIPFTAFGIRANNGSWNGLIQGLIEETIDIAPGLFYVNVERFEVVSLGSPMYFFDQLILHARPKLQPQIEGFVLPFTPTIWALVVMSLLVISWCLWVASAISLPSEEAPDASSWLRKLGHEQHGLGISHLRAFMTLVGQSFPDFMPSTSLEVLTWTWIVGSLFIGFFYRSNLIAMLAMPKIKIPFDSLEELVTTSMKWKIIFSGSIHQAALAAESDSPLARFLAQSSGYVYHYSEGEREVGENGVAIVMGSVTALAVMETYDPKNGECPLTVAREKVITGTPASMAFIKGSKLVAKCNRIVNNLKESGLLDYWVATALPGGTRCIKTFGVTVAPELRPLKLKDFNGVFILYVVGMMTALLLFLIEMVLGNFYKPPDIDSS